MPLAPHPSKLPARPKNAERNERGQSVPPSLRATMLRLLRLPFFRSLRVENSRNPGFQPARC